MTLSRSIGNMEIIIISLYILFYFFYAVKLFQAKKVLSSTLWKAFLKFVTRSIMLACFIIALLKPTFGDAQKKEVQAVGKDIYILLDISKSMDANDIQPSRLERTKYQMNKIISSFKTDRIGLIVFSSLAYVQCPLTNDHSNLSIYLETLRTNLITPSGTNFGAALSLAIEKFATDKATEKVEKKSKVVILVSDGEDFGEETQQALDKVKDANITLFTLGIGTKKGVKLRQRNGYKLDKNGNEIISKLDPESLKSMAQEASGKYFEISDDRDDTNRMIDKIASIQGRVIDTTEIDEAANKYYYFVAFGLFIFALDFLFKFRIFSI